MTLDLDRITHPLRLASGSHQRGSGKGCAMNAISYINGDVEITDYPDCSARPLARMVQQLNDQLAGPDGFLSPENSIIVLDLGWLTVGTAGAPRMVVWRWLADLLIDPEMGVVKYARPDGVAAIRGVAALCMRESVGDRVPASEWAAARKDAQKARAAAYAAADAYAYAAADAYAYAAADAYAYAAADAYADADAYAYAAADAYAYAAADAYAYAAADAYADADAYAYAAADARIKFTRWAIRHWRDLAGLDNHEADTDAVNAALAQMV